MASTRTAPFLGQSRRRGSYCLLVRTMKAGAARLLLFVIMSSVVFRRSRALTMRMQPHLLGRVVLSADDRGGPRGRFANLDGGCLPSPTASTLSSLSLSSHWRRRCRTITKARFSSNNHLWSRTVLAAHQHEGSPSSASFSSSSLSEATPTSFRDMGLHPVLVERLEKLDITVPTVVQKSAFPALLTSQKDVTIGSETGSGKTLAYLLPIFHDILTKRDEQTATCASHEYARAMILVPNKELVQQVVRMALPLAGGPDALVSSSPSFSPETSDDDQHLIRIAVIPGGLNDPDDFRPFRDALQGRAPPPDVVVSTPAIVAPWGVKPKCIGFFADLQTLVVDEADMCVDGGYIRAVEHVLLGFKRADRMLAKYQMEEESQSESSSSSLQAGRKTQHVFVAATIPDYGLRSVSAWLSRKFPKMMRVETDDLHRARHSGLTETTQWVQLESKRDRMQHLVNLLSSDLTNDKTMVFCNSVDDVDSVSQALQRAGFANAVPYHAKLSLQDRTSNLERFRSYHPPPTSTSSSDAVILVCTDLASRGLDVPGVTAVVQLQFAGNAVAHLHRMGRCGRAATERGRGVVYYGAQESELVHVLREAEMQLEQQGSSLQLAGEVKDESAWNDAVENDYDFEEEDDDLEARSSDLRERADERTAEDGTIRNAFSRKRGFTKKRKKLRSRSSDTD